MDAEKGLPISLGLNAHQGTPGLGVSISAQQGRLLFDGGLLDERGHGQFPTELLVERGHGQFPTELLVDRGHQAEGQDGVKSETGALILFGEGGRRYIEGAYRDVERG